jgi:hypothetical protein
VQAARSGFLPEAASGREALPQDEPAFQYVPGIAAHKHFKSTRIVHFPEIIIKIFQVIEP